MKVISLNLSTPSSGNYAPIDKSNLANVKWSINWKEVFGEKFNQNLMCRVKVRLISSQSNQLSTANNTGPVHASFQSNYSNIANGLVLGVPIIRPTSDNSSLITQFIGSIATTVLSVNPFGYGSLLTVTGATAGAASTTLTLASATSLPIGAVISCNSISGYCVLVSQASTTSYIMSSSETIPTGSSIIAGLPNNTCLSIGSLISGYGVTSGTQITAQTGPYSYTVNQLQTITPTSMISNPTNYYLDLDIQDSDGLTITTPMSNYFTI